MKTWICLLPSFLCLSLSLAQNRQSIYFELAGSGGLGSLNIEQEFYQKKIGLSWSAGISFAPIDRNNGVGIVVPLMLHSLIGKGPNKLELGLGQGITFTTKGSFFARAIPVLGYRYQGDRWFYRVSYTPLVSYLIDLQYQHWAGLSIGYSLQP